MADELYKRLCQIPPEDPALARLPIPLFCAVLRERVFGQITSAQALDRLDARKPSAVLSAAERTQAQTLIDTFNALTDNQKAARILEIYFVLVVADRGLCPAYPTAAAIRQRIIGA